MSWTQTLIAAVLTATLIFGGIVGLAVWAAPSWAGALWNVDHTWWEARRPRSSRWHAREGKPSHSGQPHDYCDRLDDFNTEFLRDHLIKELDLNASQKADFNALVLAFTQSGERLRAESCTVETNQRSLPERFLQTARAVDHVSEEMHALTTPLSQFYRGLSEDQRMKLDKMIEHRRGNR